MHALIYIQKKTPALHRLEIYRKAHVYYVIILYSMTRTSMLITALYQTKSTP